jgi:hypothetical protein
VRHYFEPRRKAVERISAREVRTLEGPGAAARLAAIQKQFKRLNEPPNAPPPLLLWAVVVFALFDAAVLFDLAL